jgi:hypothetical protein
MIDAKRTCPFSGETTIREKARPPNVPAASCVQLAPASVDL